MKRVVAVTASVLLLTACDQEIPSGERPFSVSDYHNPHIFDSVTVHPTGFITFDVDQQPHRVRASIPIYVDNHTDTTVHVGPIGLSCTRNDGSGQLTDVFYDSTLQPGTALRPHSDTVGVMTAEFPRCETEVVYLVVSIGTEVHRWHLPLSAVSEGRAHSGQE